MVHVNKQKILQFVERRIVHLRQRCGFDPLPVPLQRIRKVLVVRNNDFGDVLLATPIFRAIKRHLPQAEVHVCVGPWAQELLLGNPNVDRVLVYNVPWGNKKLRGGWQQAIQFLFSSPLIPQLRSEQYDVGIDVAGNLWTAWLLKRGKVRFRIGIGGYQGGGLFHHCSVPFSTAEHVSRMGLRLLEPLGIFSSDTTLDLPLRDEDHAATTALLQAVGILTDDYIILSPGVGWPPARAWIPEYFAGVGRLFFDRFDWRSLVTGSASESSLTRKVAEAIGPSGHDLGGKTSVRQLAGLIKRARLVACNSSASLHIAHALGTPSVVIVGGTDGGLSVQRRLWGYPTDCIVLGTDDRNCAVECGPYCQTRECMRAITPEEVFEAGLFLLSTSAVPT